VTKNSTGSWSKPASIGDDDWVFFYGVGGGGSGSENANIVGGGGGGGAFVVALQGAAIPSSVSFVIGAGGAASSAPINGGDTTLTVDGFVFTASGGLFGNWGSGAKTYNGGSGEFFYPYSAADTSMLDATVRGGRAAWDAGAATESTFGAGGGGMSQYGRPTGGVSTYAGNGGYANSDGVFPGGGAGSGGSYNLSAGSGAAGQLRIYYG
jgi:hypothetical protein